MSTREIVETWLIGLTTIVYYICLSFGNISHMNLLKIWRIKIIVLNSFISYLFGIAIYYIGEMET